MSINKENNMLYSTILLLYLSRTTNIKNRIII